MRVIMIDENKLLEALVPILDECGDMYLAGRIAGCIMAQPKISLENKTSDNMNSSCSGQVWIPVEKALPEPYVDVIVTYIYNEKKYVRTAFNCNGKNWWWTDIQKDFDVIAWQPLPKAYEVQDET
jgi:hypothetical protein